MVQLPTAVDVSLVVSGFSLVLTGALVYLYYGQLEVQKQQQQLMKLEQEPFVEYERYEVEDDGVYVWLSNFGHGVAARLRLSLEIRLPDGTHLSTPEDNSPLQRKEDEIWQSGKALRGHQSNVYYYGVPAVEIENGTEVVRRFREVTRILLSRDIHTFEFRISVLYSSRVGEEDEVPLRSSHTVEISEPCTLEEAIDQSRSYPYDYEKWTVEEK